MATFPTLVPNDISFDYGVSNISEVSTFAGPVRFRHSKRINGHTLRLNYRGLSQTQTEELRTHYINSDGILRRFNLPTALWGGLSVVAADAEYRYTAPPQEEHMGLYYNVSITLKILDGTVSFYILNGNGAELPAQAVFSAGVFNGTAPFVLDCGDADPTVTLLLEAGGAKL